jgi:hypothetical protein
MGDRALNEIQAVGFNAGHASGGKISEDAHFISANSIEGVKNSMNLEFTAAANHLTVKWRFDCVAAWV